MGGGAYFLQNDINDHLQGWNDYIADLAGLAPIVSTESELNLINMGMDFSGEILINFMPHLGIGIGAGYISSAGKESTMEVSDNIGNFESITFNPQFSAIPITFSLYYGIPVGGMMEVVLNGGAGYYLGTVNYDMFSEGGYLGLTYEETEKWSSQSNALGFHGGINFEFGFSSNFAFVIGARGRHVKFTDLTGDLEWEYSDSGGYSSSGTDEDQTLWFGHWEHYYTGKEYPRIILTENKPSLSIWSDVRKAEVNLSGIVFQAGIKVTF